MPAQQRYIRSILSTFATFLANADIGQLAKESGIPETRLNIAVQELLVEFLRWKSEYSIWSAEEIEQFSQESSLSAIQLTTLPLLIQFVNEYPPHQTNVFLQEFLLALKKDGCSNSTVKNYRSDISQFIDFCDENEIESLLTKTKLDNFYRYQKENKLKDSTIKRKMSSIVQFGIWLKAEAIIAQPPKWLKAGFVYEASEKNRSWTAGKVLASSSFPQEEAKLRASLERERSEKIDLAQKKLTTPSGVVSGGLLSRIFKRVANSSLTSSLILHKQKPDVKKDQSWTAGDSNPFAQDVKPRLEPSAAHDNSRITNETDANRRKNLTTSSLTKTITPTPGKRNLLSLAKLPVSSVEAHPASGSPLKHQEKRAQLKSSLGGLSEQIRTRIADTFEQVKQKASLNILPYVNLALIVLFFLGLGSLGYSQLITNAPYNLAYSTQPTPPGRTLSFQGRLTDQGQNPITTNTAMTFRLYNVLTGGTALWTSSGCTVEPDQDGIFAVGLGDLVECGPAISSDIFSENPNIWLEVQVDTETLSPRQPIRTVAYALNAETLQGYPLAPTGGAEANTVVTMNNDSVVLFSEAVVLETATGSNADIKLAADGTGLVNLDDLLYVSSSAGGVGIGTTNPGSAMLSVMTGNVGIGTTAPNSTLQVVGTFSLTSGEVVNNIRPDVRAIGVADDESLVTEAAIADAIGASASKWEVTSGYLTPKSSFADNVAVPSGKFAVGYGSVGASGVAAFSGNVGIGTTSPASIFQINGGVGTLTTGLTLGDGDTGFFEAGDDDIRFVTGGTSRFRLATNFGATTTGGPWIINSASSATAPIFTPNNDSNTGLGFAGADIVSLIAGGTNGLNVISTGNVGIGTTSPTGKLNVTRSATGVLLRLDGNSQSGNLIEAGYANSGDHFRVTNAGTIFVQPPSGGNNLIQLRENTAQASMIRFEDGSSNILGTINRVTTSDRLGLRLYNTLETTAFNYERLSIYPDPTNNIFRIDAERGGTGVLRNLVLQGGGGNVGIGTTSPIYHLDVVSGANVAARFDGRVIGEDAVAAEEFVTLGQLSAGTGQYWQRNSTLLSPSIITDAVSVGSTTPANAMFYVPGTTNSNAWFNLGTGNVGIGTVTPSALLNLYSPTANSRILIDNPAANAPGIQFASAGSNNWAIYRPASSTDLRFYDYSGTAGDRLTLQSSTGNVGIGTTSPADILDVRGNARFGSGVIAATSVPDSYVSVSNNNVGESTGFFMYNSTGASNRRGWLRMNDSTGNMELGMTYGTGSPGLTISTGANVERMRVTNIGNVGIGTTTPGDKLSVGSYETPTVASNQDKTIAVYGDGAAYFRGRDITNDIEFIMGTSNLGSAFAGAMTAHDFQLRTNNTTRVTIKAGTGNVGISTTTPAQRLDVSGNAQFSGALMPAGNAGVTTYVLSSTGSSSAPTWVDPSTLGTNYWQKNSNVLSPVTITDAVSVGSTTSTSAMFYVPGTTNNDAWFNLGTGRLGIGVTNPSYSLHVLDSTYSSKYYTPGVTADAGTWSGYRVGASYAGHLQSGINSSADMILTQNAYVNRVSSNADYKWTTTHASFGSRAIQMGYQSGISFYADSVASTANASFTPTERMRVTNAGNVGIGTTSPKAKLDVSSGTDTDIGEVSFVLGGTTANSRQARITKDTSSPRLLSILSSASTTKAPMAFFTATDSERLRIDTTGNIGVGITNPSSTLHVNGDFRLASGTNVNNIVTTLGNPGTDDNLVTEAAIRTALNAGSGGMWEVSAGSLIPISSFSNNVAVPSGKLAVGYTGVGASGTVAFSGNVGIGTTAPSTSLHVVNASNNHIRSQRTSNTYVDLYAGAAAYGSGLMTDNNLLFSTNADATDPEMVILTSGNVGIGTTTPSYPLTVQGSGSQFGIEVAGTNRAMIQATSTVFDFNHLADPTGISYIRFFRNTNTTGTKIVQFLRGDNSTTADAQIGVDGSNSYFNSGNFGIGTTTPLYKLQVNGDTKIETNLTALNIIGIEDHNPSYNFVENGSFELDHDGNSLPDSWSFSGQASSGNTTSILSTVGEATKGKSFLQTYMADVAEISFYSDYIPVTPNYTYYAAVDVKQAGATTAGLYMYAYYYKEDLTAATTTYTTLASNLTVPNTWTTRGGTFTTPADAKFVRIRLRHHTNASGPDTWSWDNVRMMHSYAPTFLRIGSDAIENTTAVSNPLEIYSGSSELLRVTSAGNVGIGTTNPLYKLDVTGDIYSSANIRANTNVYIAGTALSANTSLTSGASKIGLYDNAMTYIAANTNVQGAIKELDTAIYNLGSGSSGLWLDGGVNDYLYPNTTYSNNVYLGTGNLGIGFDPSALGGGTKLAVNGNVGIGTTNPSEKLSVSGDVYIAGSGSTIGRATLANASLKIGSTLGIDNNEFYFGTLGYIGTIGAYDLNFDTNATTRIAIGSTGDIDMNSGQLFVQQSSGNVGIGTTSPTELLQVGGTGERILRYNGSGRLSIGSTTGGWANMLAFLGSAGTNRGGFGAYGSDDNLTYLYAGDAYNSTTMVWRSGNVGIGTTNPSAFKLQVSGDVGPQTNNTSSLGSTGTRWANVFGVLGNFSTSVTTPLVTNAGTLALSATGSNVITLSTNGSERWRVASNGVLQSNGAQTIQTSTGNLTLATAGGNGHIVLSPNGTGNVGIGTTSPRGTLHVPGSFVTSNSNGTVRKYSSSISSTQSGMIKMGEMLIAGNSQEIRIEGKITGQQGSAGGETEFGISIRSDTLPTKYIRHWQTQTNGGRVLDLKVYHDTTSGRVVVGFETSAALHSFGWDITIYERGDYDYWQNQDTYAVLDTTGLTEIARGTNHFNFNPGGNVGIGTTSPAQSLDVVGNVKFSGALMPNNAAGTSGQFLISAGADNPPTWTSTVPATSLKWNALTNPDGNLSLGMGTYTTTFNWATGTGANNLFNLTTDSSNGTGSLLNIQTQGTTMSPLRVRAGSNEALFVSGGGNVGVGTTAPDFKLEVAGSTKIGVDNTSNSGVLEIARGAKTGFINNHHNPQIYTGATNFPASGDPLGALVIQARSSIAGAPIVFAGGSSTTSEWMRIVNGNVGIGTTSPGSLLHLDFATSSSNYTHSTVTGSLYLESNPNSGTGYLGTGIILGNVAGATSNNPQLGSSIYNIQPSSDTDSSGIGFAVHGNTNADPRFEAMRIDHAGRVGIGTTNPSELLTLGVTSDGSAASRKSIQFNNGGWAAPGATTATSDGDKLILYKSATEAYKIGLESSNIWLQSHAGIKIYNSSATQTANIAVGSGNSWFNTGNLGIGTSSPAERLHVYDDTGITAYTTTNSGNGNLIVQSAYGGRTVGTGAALAFSIPANTDGTNFWDQGRILTTPDNNSNGSASGRMYLQTRYYTGSAWSWRDNLVLRSNGNVGVGTTTPSSTLHVNGDFRLASGTNVNNIVTTLGNPGSDNNLVTEAAIRTAIGSAIATESSFAVVAGNWYTIATNPGNRAYATFEVWDTESGRHASMQFNAGASYNSTGVITMLGKSWYAGGGIFNNVRIRGATTYDTQYLQIYATANGTLRVRMHNNIQSSGWTLTSDGAPTGAPGTATKAEVDPNEANGLATNGGGYFGNNVGIGVTNPSATLQVAGSARIDDYLGVGVAPDSTYRIYANGAAYGIRAHGSTMGGRFEDSNGTSRVYAAYGNHGIYQNLGTLNYFLGNVGIGTGADTPTSKLHVIGATAGDNTWKEGIIIENTNATAGEPALSFKNSLTGSNYWITGLNQNSHYDIAYGTGFTNATTLFRIQSNDGNVGIGTTSPTKKLHVNGDIRANVYFDTTGSDEYYLDLNNSGRAFSLLGSASIGGYSVNTATTKLSVMGGNVGIGTTNANTSLTIYNQHAMALSAGGDIGAYGAPAGSYPLRLFESFGWNFTVQNLADSGFRIHPPENTTYTNTPYFVVKYGGNVGIRINNPEAPIHTIAYTTGDQALFQKWSYSNAAPDQYRLNLKQTVTSGVVRYTFDLRNNNTNYDNMLTFDRGNVGIGVTSPGYKLDVSGTAHITGLSTLDSNLVFTQGSSARNIGVVGTYSPNSLASIWSMGAAYQLTSAGGAGNLYGLSYSYEPNYGGAGNNPGAIAGLGHQMQWRANGTTQTAIGTGIYTAGNLGIGTTSSALKFDVRPDGGAASIRIGGSTLNGNAGNDYPRLYMGGSSTSVAGVINRIQAAATIYMGESGDTGGYQFRGGGHAYFQGNVGIGTTNPLDTLHINSGTIRLESLKGCSIATDNSGRIVCSSAGTPTNATVTGSYTAFGSNNYCHTSFTSYCQYSPTYTIDGDPGTIWYPAAFDSYLQIDYQQLQYLSSTRYINVNAFWDTGYGTCAIRVWTSTDASTWTALHSGSYYAAATSQAYRWIPFATAANFRYVRVQVGQSAGDSCGWQGIKEVAVGGDLAGADLAENYLTKDNLIPGHLVSITPNSEDHREVQRASLQESKNILGIVTTNPHETMDNFLNIDGYKTEGIALTGRVPAIVSTESGNINSDDSITSSSILGVGMKAVSAGSTIAKALESTKSWSSATCPAVSSIDEIEWPFDDGTNPSKPCFTLPDGTQVGKVMVFIGASWYDPDVYLESVGGINQLSSAPTSSSLLDAAILETLDYSIRDDSTNTAVTRLGNFAEVAIGKINAGLTKTSSLIAENAVITRAKIADLSTNTLLATKATIDELTTRSIKLGNFELKEVDGKLQIINQNSQTVATIDQDGNTQIEGNITAQSAQIEQNSLDTSSALGKLVAQEIQTTNLTATGSTQLAELMTDSVETDSLTVTGTSQLGELIATNIDAEAVETNSLIATNLEVTDQLTAQNSRFEQLEAKIAELDEIKATTANIVNGEFETVTTNSLAGNNLNFDQATIKDVTVSGSLYADVIVGFEEKVAQAFRQPSLLGSLLGSSDEYELQQQKLVEIIESAGYTATNSNQLRQSLADLNLGADDVVIAPAAAFVNRYLEVNGSAYIADSLAINNYLVIGDGLKMAATASMASIDYVSSSDPVNSTLYLQSSGIGRIDLMAGLMTIDSSGSVIINGDIWIAGNVGIDGALSTNTLLTNLIESNDYDRPTQIRLGAYVDENGNTIYGEVAGDSTENTQLKQSRLEIIDERGAAVATISATGRAEFADGLGIGTEDLSGEAGQEETSVTHKTSGRAKIESGQQQIIIRSSKVSANSQIFVTPLGSTNNQVLYVKSQVADDPSTSDVEGLFIVGFDAPTSNDVLFNWWIVN